jgi:hypothetical protein
MMAVEVQENCFFCKKSLLDQEWVWVCKNCRISWCDEHKKTHFKWNAWSGLSKEHCPNCGNPLKSDNVEILPKFSEWEERFGVKPAVPEPTKPEPAAVQPAAQPVEESLSADPAPQPAAPAPRPEKKKSIVGPVLMLIPFGALTIYGVVALVTLYEEGFYWILLALGCISFGGRISIASIQEIREYFKQKSA